MFTTRGIPATVVCYLNRTRPTELATPSLRCFCTRVWFRKLARCCHRHPPCIHRDHWPIPLLSATAEANNWGKILDLQSLLSLHCWERNRVLWHEAGTPLYVSSFSFPFIRCCFLAHESHVSQCSWGLPVCLQPYLWGSAMRTCRQ